MLIKFGQDPHGRRGALHAPFDVGSPARGRVQRAPTQGRPVLADTYAEPLVLYALV